MGYGLDTGKYGTRKWGKTITWSGEVKGKLQEGLDAWQAALGITFQKTQSDPDFTIEWTDKRCQWQSRSAGNGKPDAGKTGTLSLTANASLGTVIHEVGHLLGLSHEQDHPRAYKSWYKEHPISPFDIEGVERRAGDNKVWADYDATSVMHYPEQHYGQMAAPSAGDIASIKALNGW